MAASGFAGDRKRSDSLLAVWERTFVARNVHRVPTWVRSHHLTLMTLGWSVCVLAASALARRHLGWLWVASAAIAGQYLTDAVDGKIGKLRGAGLVKWGFYMDHLLDYVFLCSILLGYALLVPASQQWIVAAIMAVAGGFMVSSFLACALTGYLQISYVRLGPIEVRLALVGINTWLALGGRTALDVALPLVLLGLMAVLAFMVFQTQRRLWKVDAAASLRSTAPMPTDSVRRPDAALKRA